MAVTGAHGSQPSGEVPEGPDLYLGERSGALVVEREGVGSKVFGSCGEAVDTRIVLQLRCAETPTRASSPTYEVNTAAKCVAAFVILCVLFTSNIMFLSRPSFFVFCLLLLLRRLGLFARSVYGTNAGAMVCLCLCLCVCICLRAFCVAIEYQPTRMSYGDFS